MMELVSRAARFWQLPRRERLRRVARKLITRYLDNRRGGILHVGAHNGREALAYGMRRVIWFEANPALMPLLSQQLEAFPSQRAFCVALGDRVGQVDFHVAPDDGETSSLFDFGRFASGHDSLWPALDLRMEKTIRVNMTTLDAFLADHRLDPADYDRWFIDVQGAELLVLEGAQKSLPHCRVLFTEISTVEVYRGAALYPDVKRVLDAAGFVALADPEQLGIRHGGVTFVHRSLCRSLYFRALLALLRMQPSSMPGTYTSPA